MSKALLYDSAVCIGCKQCENTLSLRHCQDYSCVMASSHSVECIDLRDSTLCDSCRSQVDSNPSMAERHS